MINKAESKQYFHITSSDNIPQILLEGIKGIEGEIFLVTFPILFEVSDSFQIFSSIAKNQIGLIDEFALITVKSEGIEGEIIYDSVAELTAKYQIIVKQEIIKPEYVSLSGRRHKIKYDMNKVTRLCGYNF